MVERTRVVAYIRVSTEVQADEGVSLAAQRSKVLAYADLYDLEIVAIVEDAGASAKSLQREGLRDAVSVLEAGGADGLLVAKLDRLTRSVRDLGSLLDLGFRDRWALLSVGEQVDTRSASGRMVLNILAVISQWEREAIGERTREALAHLKAEGAVLGGEALGWERSSERDDQGRLVVKEVRQEATTVKLILRLREEGCSLREIARRLDAQGVPTKRGGKWVHTTVRKVLRRAQAAA